MIVNDYTNLCLKVCAGMSNSELEALSVAGIHDTLIIMKAQIANDKTLIAELVTECELAEKQIGIFVKAGYCRPEATEHLTTVIEKAKTHVN